MKIVRVTPAATAADNHLAHGAGFGAAAVVAQTRRLHGLQRDMTAARALSLDRCARPAYLACDATTLILRASGAGLQQCQVQPPEAADPPSIDMDGRQTHHATCRVSQVPDALADRVACIRAQMCQCACCATANCQWRQHMKVRSCVLLPSLDANPRVMHAPDWTLRTRGDVQHTSVDP